MAVWKRVRFQWIR